MLVEVICSNFVNLAKYVCIIYLFIVLIISDIVNGSEVFVRKLHKYHFMIGDWKQFAISRSCTPRQ